MPAQMTLKEFNSEVINNSDIELEVPVSLEYLLDPISVFIPPYSKLVNDGRSLAVIGI